MADHDETPDPLDDLAATIDAIAGSPLVETATRLHELFLALQAGGFTEDQALRITVLFTQSRMSNDPED